MSVQDDEVRQLAHVQADLEREFGPRLSSEQVARRPPRDRRPLRRRSDPQLRARPRPAPGPPIAPTTDESATVEPTERSMPR